MLKTKLSRYQRYSRLFGPFILSGATLLLALLGLAGLQPAASTVQAAPAGQGGTSAVTFVLDDFDDAKTDPNAAMRKIPRSPNNFFANQATYTVGQSGALITDSITCPVTHSCYLTLDYDVTNIITSEGGYVEELGFSYTYDGGNPATWELRDMSSCQSFSFQVKGDETEPFTTRFGVEFIGHDWGVRDQFTVTGVISTAWQTKTISLNNLSQVDPMRIKQVAFRLRNDQVTAQTGRLHFDNLAFNGCQMPGGLLDVMEQQAFAYFWELRHPDTGFVRDRAVDPFPGNDRNVTSIAAIGFELTAFGIGAERGWINRDEAATATLQVLDKLLAITSTASHKGFYYHILDIKTGARDGDTELSTIDTALLMAGVLFARQYFNGTNDTEVAIRQQATRLFNQVEWDWALRTEATPADNANRFYLAWKLVEEDGFKIPAPGGGYFAGTPSDPTTWDYYTDEILLINLLALGSPTHRVASDTFTAWPRVQGSYGEYTFIQSYFGSLFTHFIGQVWLDLRGVTDPQDSINWYENSGKAALANRQFAIDQAMTYTTYSTDSWGISANLGPPTSPFTIGLAGVGIYTNYGVIPNGSGVAQHDGTLAPYAVAGSLMFSGTNSSAEVARQTLDNWYQNQPRLWGLYGFVDGFNLGQTKTISDDWFAHDYVSIDQGMTLLALENYQQQFVWQVMDRDPVIVRAKCLAFGECYIYLPIILKNA